MGNKELTRRSFLTGSIAAAGAFAALGGCSPATTQSSATESKAEISDEMSVRQHAAKLNPQTNETSGESGTMEHIFSEWKFGSLTLPNRIVKSAAGRRGQWGEGLAGPEPVNYYAGMARGGTAMIFMDDIPEMYEHFKASPGVGKISDWTDDEFKTLIDAVHAEGAYFGYQLASMGLVFSGFVDTGVPFVSSTCNDMSAEEIQLFIQDTMNAASKLKSLGFDAVEINAAGENIGQTFLSRNVNKREDDYGPQTLENRARFVCDLIRGIKKSCGNDFPVQVLINGVEENDVNLGDNALYTTVEENIQFAKMFEEAGADSLHIRIGPRGQHVCQFAGDLYFTGYGIEGTTGYGTQFDFKRHWQGKLKADRSGLGLMVDVAAEIKEAVSIPVGCVTYMDPARDPEYFDSIIADEKIDFMLMNRPLGVDFEYVNKLKEGRLSEIAPCTRCMHCHFDYDREGNLDPHCRVNAAGFRAYRDTMPEGFEPLPAETKKNVMVIGGGPAGMEAARIAAQRGHSVTLYEKNGSLGGLLDFAHATKGSHENIDALRAYLAEQLDIAEVSIVCGKEVDSDFITSQAPDVVILATGGVRPSSGLSGTNGTKIVPLPDFLTTDLGENVTILGENAQAVDAAMRLLAEGVNVTMVTPNSLSKLGEGHSSWVKTFETPMLKALGVRVWPEASISKVEDGAITILTDSGVEVDIPCDSVIEALDMEPDASLIDNISIESYAVGDCADPFNIANAIYTANLTARMI